MMTSAELCKALREKHGFTQEALAAMLGVHPMTVSRWERGAPTTSHTGLLLYIIFHADQTTIDTIRAFSPKE